MKTHVVLLLLARCPSAISWRIAFVIVDAVERFAVWAFSHIGQEVSEGKPSLADGDATPAIFSVRAIVRIRATLSHAVPRLIGRRWRLTRWRMAMLDHGSLATRSEYTLGHAAAGLCPAAAQLVANDNRCIAAITTAKPRSISSLSACALCYQKLAESLANQINGEVSSHWRIV